MKYQEHWPEARERWIALWEGRDTDRPVMTVTAPNGRNVPVPQPVSGEQKWLDPEFIVRSMQARMENTYYAGESFPGGLLMAGWVANTYGAVPHFPLETIWFEPLTVDWDHPPSFELDWNSPWLHKVEAIHKAVLAAAGRDNFMVGPAGIMPGNDLLAMVIGGDQFLLSLTDRPEWTRQVILKLAQNRIELLQHFFRMSRDIHEYWYGNVSWMPFWAPELYMSEQSDISCMLSPKMFDAFIVPELELDGRAFKNLWYHLDGQSAFQHLPRLCSLPFIRAIQFMPMAGTPHNGPAHLDLYKKIQAAGKIVHISVPVGNIEPLVKQLDPRLLCINTGCENPRQADELLAAAKRWTRGGGRG